MQFSHRAQAVKKPWPRSLKQRLIAQLLVLQLAILLAFGLSFVSLLVLADEGGVLVSPRPVEVAFDAIRRGADGKLVLTKTEEMGDVRARHPDFWFIARNDHGETVQIGDVPAIYRGMSENLGKMTYSDIRDAGDPSPYLAVLRRRSNAEEDFTVFGQGELMSQSALILQFSRFSLAPMLILLTLVTVAGVPWIVNRASRDISELARETQEINIDRRDYRLPETTIPNEVRPLVRGMNDALHRLDQAYGRHQRFILDAAHELRTPVAILQARLDSLVAGPARDRLHRRLRANLRACRAIARSAAAGSERQAAGTGCGARSQSRVADCPAAWRSNDGSAVAKRWRLYPHGLWQGGCRAGPASRASTNIKLPIAPALA
ncbi:hypothetical protein [Ensifer sp. SSB1]|uniref:hypothetical protein n=1 Tax=Ensifer sp. SSB1 TaxID=2795385 RepID=UPI0025C3712E|nr:hypothetical protein [Ensifer sp. SSB1]